MGRVCGVVVGTAPRLLLATTPTSPQGGVQWGESSPVSPRLLIGCGTPQCPPPAPSLAGAATSVVVANAARVVGTAAPHQGLPAPPEARHPSSVPRPLPACPPSQAAQLPCMPPLSTRPVPPGQAHAGAWAPAPGPSTLQGAPGEGGGEKVGAGSQSSSFSERAQSRSQKSRRRDIQTEPRRVWQEREGEREREGRREEGGRKGVGGPQFPNPCPPSPRGTVWASRVREPGRPGGGLGMAGAVGSGPQRQPHTLWPGQGGHGQKPRSMCSGQPEGGLQAAEHTPHLAAHTTGLCAAGRATESSPPGKDQRPRDAGTGATRQGVSWGRAWDTHHHRCHSQMHVRHADPCPAVTPITQKCMLEHMASWGHSSPTGTWRQRQEPQPSIVAP